MKAQIELLGVLGPDLLMDQPEAPGPSQSWSFLQHEGPPQRSTLTTIRNIEPSTNCCSLLASERVGLLHPKRSPNSTAVSRSTPMQARERHDSLMSLVSPKDSSLPLVCVLVTPQGLGAVELPCTEVAWKDPHVAKGRRSGHWL